MEVPIKRTDLDSGQADQETDEEGHYFPPLHLPLIERMIMRTLDIAVASTVLTLCFPLMLAIGIVIRLDSKGPALFRQVRIGQNRRYGIMSRPVGRDRRRRNLLGSPFLFYKFRTMYVDAQERWPELYRYEYDENKIGRLQFKLDNDPRVTRVGKFLRRSTLDELPNFINVLIGNMTLVGPRPDIPQMMKYYKPWHMQKFQVKPGVTGLAQVQGRGHLTFGETLDRDVSYVKNKSFVLDMKLLFSTLKAILTGDGAF